MQSPGYLYTLGDKSVIVPCEPKKAPDLSDDGGAGPFLIASIFPSSVTIPWEESMCPKYVICLWNSSHLGGLIFSLVSGTWLAGSFEKMTI